MIVYHGTDSYSAQNIIENGIDLKRGDDSVDNGQGFYTSPSREFAAERAKFATRLANRDSDYILKPVVLQIEIDESEFAALNVAEFPECTYEWKEFVFYNRTGKQFLHDQEITSSNHNLDCEFDVVIDETADSGITKIVRSFKYNQSRRSTDWSTVINRIDKSKSKFWDNQISFHSSRSLHCIKSMQVVEIQKLRIK